MLHIKKANDFYQNKKKEIGNLLNLTKVNKSQNNVGVLKMKFWDDECIYKLT